MSLGIFSPRSTGLGQSEPAVVIPWQCWDKPGFKDCHARQYARQEKSCKSGYADSHYGGDVQACIREGTNKAALAECVPAYCAEAQYAKLQTPTITAYQAQANKELAAQNHYPIAVDGKLGKQTCGAAQWADGAPWMMSGSYDWTRHDEILGACAGRAFSLPQPKNPDDALYTEGDCTQGPGWGATDWRIGNLQKELNGHLTGRGYPPIPITNQLDAPTCGAMRWADSVAGTGYECLWGANCQGFLMPAKPAPEPPAPSPVPSPDPPPEPAPAPRTNQATMLAGAALVAAVGIGAYVIGKDRGWFQ